MGIPIGDSDGDGDYDMYVSNGEEGNPLFRNNGNGTYTDVGAMLGLGVYKVCWGNAFYDYDNDGDLDLYVVASSGAPNSRNPLFRNNGNGTFNSLQNIGLNESAVSYGLGIGDINNDAYPEMFVVNVYDPCNLYKNSGGTNNWIKLKFQGTSSNRDGIGCLIELYKGTTKIIRYVNGGISYLSQNTLVQTIGMGTSSSADSIIIKWPSGSRTKLSQVSVNQLITVTENPIGIHGSSTEVPLSFELYQNYPNPFNPVTKIEYAVSIPGEVSISVYDMLGRIVKNLVNGFKNSGYYSVDFEGNSIPSGIYFYKMSANGFTKTNKMILIK
jgi:hypothetical protein